MKKIPLLLVLCLCSFIGLAQSNVTLLRHTTKDTIRPKTKDTDVTDIYVYQHAYVKPVVKPIPPINPLPVPTPYKNTVRYGLATHAYKMSENGYTPGQSVMSIPDLKGTANLAYTGTANPLLVFPCYEPEGTIWMQNEANISYTKQLGAAPVAKELYMVIMIPDFFVFEAVINFYDLPYFSQLNGNNIGMRLQNNTSYYPNFVWPDDRYMVIRYQVLNTNFNPDVAVSVNGVSLGVALPTQPVKSNVIGFGTGSNSADYGIAELIETPPLSDTQAAQVTSELMATYNVNNPVQAPYASNIKLTKANGQTTVTYTYNNPLGIPEDKTKRVIKWINWGTVGVTFATYLPQYQNMATIPTALVGRAEIWVFDTQGHSYSIPGSGFTN